MSAILGFIGLGVMGGNMARNLAKKYELMVYDKDHSRLSALTGPMIQSAGSVEEIGRTADTVFLSLPDSEAVGQVIESPGGLAETLDKGSVIIDAGTTEPAVIQRLSSMLSVRGIDLLDAPVSGGEKGAREGNLAFMVGGPEHVFERCRGMLTAMGATIIRVGESGMGQVAKLVNNLIVGATFAAVAEGFALGVKSGLHPRVLFDAIRNGWAGSPVLEVSAPAMIERNFQPGGTVNGILKDIGYALSLAEEQSVPLPVISVVHEIFKAAKASGAGNLAQPVIVTLWEKILGIEVKG